MECAADRKTVVKIFHTNLIISIPTTILARSSSCSCSCFQIKRADRGGRGHIVVLARYQDESVQGKQIQERFQPRLQEGGILSLIADGSSFLICCDII